MPTQYRRDPHKPRKAVTVGRNPYMSEQLCYKTEFWGLRFRRPDTNGLLSYDTDSDLGDRPPTATQQRQVRYKRKASIKQIEHLSL